MTSFWSAFLARSFNFDALDNIAYVVDAARWSSKSKALKKRRKIMLSNVLVTFVLFRNTVSLSIHEHGFVNTNVASTSRLFLSFRAMYASKGESRDTR